MGEAELEDAPAGHAAWGIVLKRDGANGTIGSVFPDADGKPRKFSVSTTKTGGEAEALRILRLCAVQLLDGVPRDDVERLRTSLIEKSAQASGAAGYISKACARGGRPKKAREEDKDSKGDKTPAEAISTKETEEVDKAPAKATSTKKEEAKAEAGTPADRKAVDIEDAPPSSAAHQKVRHEPSKRCCLFMFRREDGNNVRFQTTIGAAGGSLEDAMRIARVCYYKFELGLSKAMRIARACYHKFELGLSKAEVEQYRNELYQRIGGGAKVPGFVSAGGISSKKRRRDSEGKKESSILNQLRQQGRLKGALRLQGRDSKKRNATVNGIYAPVAEGFEGTMAYERIGLEGDDTKRCLFFAKDKSRWKISEDGGKNPPSEAGSESKWTFFDGKEAGWTEDAAVRCTLVGGEDVAIAKKAKAEESTADKAKPKQEKVEDDSSDSESSGSGSGSESDASDSGSDAGSKKGVQPAVPLASPAPAASTESTGSAPQGPVQGSRRACAKMLVRAGLRCQCHFSYLWDCPAAGGTAT
eukprot:TRINITY_DN7141_c0_g1_i2.p1 TRINITY_DN7141_c0_g1~~TRINITY_DN7141_c0_g1_i2.p1  ORF type:complete len:529 (-),score=123.77 TRINITY_DN7141_c0_g1_i2:47-1633(-)